MTRLPAGTENQQKKKRLAASSLPVSLLFGINVMSVGTSLENINNRCRSNLKDNTPFSYTIPQTEVGIQYRRQLKIVRCDEVATERVLFVGGGKGDEEITKRRRSRHDQLNS